MSSSNKEIWKEIKGYEGRYQISSLGRVKSLNYRRTGREKILDYKPDKSTGYIIVNLSKNDKSKSFRVHRLVAEAFISNPNNYKEVNHKDEDKTNNHVSNLEWCDRKYNLNYGTRSKRQSESIKGFKNPNATKVYCVTTEEDPFPTVQAAAQRYNIKSSNISACCAGKLKSAGKHPETGEKLVWKYID